MAQRKTSKEVIKELTSVFELLDLEGEGDLDFTEFKVGLTSIGLRVTQEEAIQLFESIDREENGYIDKVSFEAWLKKDINSQLISSLRQRLTTALETAATDDLDEELFISQEILAIQRKQDERDNSISNEDDRDRRRKSSSGGKHYPSTQTMVVHRGTSRTEEEIEESSSSSSEEEEEEEDESSDDQSGNQHTPGDLLRDDRPDASSLMDPSDPQSSQMIQQLEKMRKHEIRRVSRFVEGRQILRNEEDRRWTEEDIHDLSHEMAREINRLQSVESSRELNIPTKTSLSLQELEMEHMQSDAIDNTSGSDPASPHSHFQKSDTVKATAGSPGLRSLTTIKDDLSSLQIIADEPLPTNIDDMPGNLVKTQSSGSDDSHSVENRPSQVHFKTGSNGGPPPQHVTSNSDFDDGMWSQSATQRATAHSLSQYIENDLSTATPTTQAFTSATMQAMDASNHRRTDTGGSMHGLPLHSSVHSNPNPVINAPTYILAGGGIAGAITAKPTTIIPDISQIAAPVDPLDAIRRGLVTGQTEKDDDDETDTSANLCVRFLKWYISPLTSREAIYMIWYQGANVAFAAVSAAVMLTLLALMIALLVCCVGVYFLYAMCEVARIFASIDITLALYFFPSHLFPKFALYIPVSHAGNAKDKFREYLSDPHLIQIMLYLTFIKLPTSFISSGITLSLFSGAIAVMLTPLIYVFDSDYFNEGHFCLFGTTSVAASNDTIECSGWPIVSFADTVGAFLLFLAILPLTMHLCRLSARFLFHVTCNFLTMDVGTYRRQNVMRNNSEFL